MKTMTIESLMYEPKGTVFAFIDSDGTPYAGLHRLDTVVKGEDGKPYNFYSWDLFSRDLLGDPADQLSESWGEYGPEDARVVVWDAEDQAKFYPVIHTGMALLMDLAQQAMGQWKL